MWSSSTFLTPLLHFRLKKLKRLPLAPLIYPVLGLATFTVRPCEYLSSRFRCNFCHRMVVPPDIQQILRRRQLCFAKTAIGFFVAFALQKLRLVSRWSNKLMEHSLTLAYPQDKQQPQAKCVSASERRVHPFMLHLSLGMHLYSRS